MLLATALTCAALPGSATTEQQNSDKSHSDPAEWMPTSRAAWCVYDADYVQTKVAWNLSIDPTERDALRGTLSVC